MDKLRSGTVEPQRAVEEFVRFDGSGKAVTRVVREDVDFFGHQLLKGQRVFLILAAANRDPSVFSHPDVVDFERSEGRNNIAFGYGIHACMGAPLAKLEIAIAVPKILQRWRSIELNGELEWHATLLARGLKSLPLKVKV
jgi:cytochrome P450